LSTVYSQRWHRVAGLKPQLSPHLRLRRQRLRGETWYLLSNGLNGRSVRLNAGAYSLAGRLDGVRTVQQLWDRSLLHGADAPSQDEVIDLLAQLREAALVEFDRPADFDLLLPHLDRVAKPRGRGSLLAWRLPLANPSRLLDRLAWLAPALFSRGAFGIWLVALLGLVLLAVQHATALGAFGRTWLVTPRFALLAMVLYVPIKLLHELAHGLAVTRWGGRVREAGVTLMLLMPVPYVDASAASGFVRRRQRVAVGAAGIMTELSLAAIALPLWLWLDEGGLRDAAFVTLVITAVSTLLFNANPLQRLDGYYIATDLLDLPNLGPRSRAWWLHALRRWLLRMPGVEPMPVARGEAGWLAVYAPLAWLYAIGISLLAVAWLGQLSFALGLVTGALLGWQMLLRPLWRLLGQLRRAALAQETSTRRWRLLAVGSTLVMVLILFLPWPRSTLVQGVVWPPDQAQLRADEDGLVETVLMGDGQNAQAGDVVLQLTNPALQAAWVRQSSRVTALEATLIGAWLTGGAQAGDGRAELIAAQAELERIGERVAALAVRARVAGRLVLPGAGDLPGQFVRRGSLIGQVLTGAPATVRVALPESDARGLRVAGESIAVSVRLAASPQQAYAATLARDSVGAGMVLPSAALSTRHGGGVLTDPRDPADLKPLQPVVMLDVRLDAAPGGQRPQSTEGASVGERIGERAWVRFDDGFSPLVFQWVRALRQQVLRRFNPQF
jgi:putative peptide zinc metalloprotease protein